MADNTSDNVGAIGDGDDGGVKPVVDHQGLFEKYAAEAALHPKYADEERNERKQEEKEFFRNNWEEVCCLVSGHYTYKMEIGYNYYHGIHGGRKRHLKY